MTNLVFNVHTYCVVHPVKGEGRTLTFLKLSYRLSPWQPVTRFKLPFRHIVNENQLFTQNHIKNSKTLANSILYSMVQLEVQ